MAHTHPSFCKFTGPESRSRSVSFCRKTLLLRFLRAQVTQRKEKKDIYLPFKIYVLGLPGGTVDKNLPANTRDTGLIPDLGRSHILQSNKAHAPQLPSLCSRAHKPQLLDLWDATIEGCEPRDCSRTGESTVISLSTATKSSPHSLQLEKARAQQWRPSATKINTF